MGKTTARRRGNARCGRIPAETKTFDIARPKSLTTIANGALLISYALWMVLITDAFLIRTLTTPKALRDRCAFDAFGFSRHWTW